MNGFSHLAIEVPGEEISNEWCEPVTDEVYATARNTGKAVTEFLEKANQYNV